METIKKMLRSTGDMSQPSKDLRSGKQLGVPQWKNTASHRDVDFPCQKILGRIVPASVAIHQITVPNQAVVRK